MSITIIYTVAAVFAVSLVSLVGIFFLFLKDKTLKEFSFTLMSLAVGAMLGGALLHILPEVFEELPENTVSFAVLLGIFSFFLLEKVLHWHHSHDTHSIEEDSDLCASCNEKLSQNVKPLGKMIIFSDALHNILDGALIASAFLLSPGAGFAATIAVLLHEIPQEIADFGVLLHSGYSKTKAMLFNFLSALSAFLGAGLVFVAQSFAEAAMPVFSAFAAGSFLYIAMSDLIPELHKKQSTMEIVKQIIIIVIGISLMWVLKFFE